MLERTAGERDATKVALFLPSTHPSVICRGVSLTPTQPDSKSGGERFRHKIILIL
jgi:hypothetical protein